MNDHVICNQCDTEQVVRLGSDKCLVCGKKGFLKWVNESMPEIGMKPQVLAYPPTINRQNNESTN